MAGHSKWANIQHRKSRVDAKRGKIFTRLAKEITVAARLGGGDSSGNPRLRQAVQEARSNNMPNDNIERAILKGTGELEGVSYEECLYEGYGPGGVAVMVEAVTDNKNRTVAEVRHLFSRHGGNLGENGCVAWMFERRGFLSIDPESRSEEDCMSLALELGADDFEAGGESFVLLTAPDDYHRILDELAERGVEVSARDLAMVANNSSEVDSETGAKLQKLVDVLEDHDDVQAVWTNLEGEG